MFRPNLLDLLLPVVCHKILQVTAQDVTAATSSAPSLSTACGDIIDLVDSVLSVSAAQAYECLISVPLNIDVALRFIEYYNTTLQFYSPLAFLNHPPDGYQQPAVDVLAALRQIEQNLTAGYYRNQYDFEMSLQSLVYHVHDAHVSLKAGILSAFSFGSLFNIIAVSRDGKEPPEVYILDDLFYNPNEASPIREINGENVVSYLTRFAAANSLGSLEPHGDWNKLMYSPVQDILGTYNTFGWQVPLYPGLRHDDSLNFTLANTTIVNSSWVALYQEYYRTGPLTTGGDFYNYFVLGLLPASMNETELRGGFEFNDTSSVGLNSWNELSSAYPAHADVVQKDLSLAGGGFLTGYLLPDIAVLSIPSFDEYGDAIGTFSETVGEFIHTAQTAGRNKIVIDLQQNSDGSPILAFDAFSQFFPQIEPFAGSRRRIHPQADILGSAMTRFWSSLSPEGTTENYTMWYDFLAGDEWVVTDRINAASGRNFSSWEGYRGPLTVHQDTFSLTERYDLSDIVFDNSAFGLDLDDGDQSQAVDVGQAPWDAQQIILLTDGACSSTCALFVELMSHQAGVRTVVVGGNPSAPASMQAVSGSRGAVAYSSDILDMEFNLAGMINVTANSTLRQDPDTGMYITYAGFTLRDQVRENETTPLQFQYEAADCRNYFTLANIFSETQLWLDAANAIWTDPSLCVTGSTGYTSRSSNTSTTTGKLPPPATGFEAATSAFHGFQSSVDAKNVLENDSMHKLHDGTGTCGRNTRDFELCDPSSKSKMICWHDIACPGGQKTLSLKVFPCTGEGICGNGCGDCIPNPNIRVQERKATLDKQAISHVCQPRHGANFRVCLPRS